MIIIFDTNIWKANLYLKSPASAALKVYLRKKGARVGLPEVVRLEVERHLRNDIKYLRDRINNDHARLLAIFGDLREIILPSDEQIEELISRNFNESGLDFEEFPFTEKAARNSFMRTIDKIRPSHKSQQFKDGVLWDVCKDLASNDDVILVTDDRAFFEDDGNDKCLAHELIEETKECSHDIRIIHSISDLMHEFKQPISIKDEDIEAAINEYIGEDIIRILTSVGFNRSGGRFNVVFFATEDPNVLYVEFKAEFRCEDATEEGRIEASLHLEGDGSYSDADKSFSGLSATELSLSYLNAKGEREEKRNHYLRAKGLAIGHRTVSYSVREKLE